MKTTQLYIKGWFLWLFCCVSIYVAQAQTGLLASDFSRRNMLDAQPVYTKTQAKPTINSPIKNLSTTVIIVKPYFCEEQFIGHFPTSIKVSYDKQLIGWHYHSQNPFNTDNSDNPFSLTEQTETEEQQPQSSQLAKFKQVWYEVTALGNSGGSTDTPTWLAFTFFGILGFVALQFTLHRAELFSTFRGFASATAAGQFVREEKNFFSPASLFANATYGLTIGTFLFLTAQHFGDAQQFNTFSAWLLCVVGSLGLYLLKHLQVLSFSNWLPAQAEFHFYNFCISNLNKIIGITFLPLVLCLAYANESTQNGLFYLGFATLGAAYLYRTVRTVTMALEVILYNKFHFLIYSLCIELAPILILLKLLSIL